jgi:hypothetical protein
MKKYGVATKLLDNIDIQGIMPGKKKSKDCLALFESSIYSGIKGIL